METMDFSETSQCLTAVRWRRSKEYHNLQLNSVWLKLIKQKCSKLSKI